MTRFKVVLVIRDKNPLPEWVPGRLEAAGIDFSVRICWNKEELALHACDADLVWAYGGRRGLLVGENLTELKNCGAILRTGSGTDNVDDKTATEKGIVVVNTPHVIADQVADHAISLLFSLVRQVTRHDRLIRSGIWDSWQAMPTAPRFRGATLGLVAFGRIPRLVAKKLCGFEMLYQAYDPFVDGEVLEAHGVKGVALDELLKTSDYVSLHCPLSEKTYHLIGERELRLMQPTALLVNTARGAVIDELALIRALEEGWIAGAALDVMDSEPPNADNPLLEMENVVLTPHIAGYSDTYPQEYAEASVEAIIDLADGQWPRFVVNPKVTPRWALADRV